MKEKNADAFEIARKRRHLHLLEKLKNARSLSGTELNELKKLEGNRTAKPAGTIEAEQLIRTQAEAARYANVSTRTIRRWVEAGMPITADKQYIKAVLDTYKQNEGNKPSQARERKQEAEARLKEVNANLAEVRLTSIQGGFVRAEDVRKKDIEKILVLKRTMLGQGSRLMDRIAMKTPQQAKAILDEDNRHSINVFAGEEIC